jgi:hypothetical protein
MFTATLYRYASAHQVAPGFWAENFWVAWRPKSSWLWLGS